MLNEESFEEIRPQLTDKGWYIVLESSLRDIIVDHYTSHDELDRFDYIEASHIADKYIAAWIKAVNEGAT